MASPRHLRLIALLLVPLFAATPRLPEAAPAAAKGTAPTAAPTKKKGKLAKRDESRLEAVLEVTQGGQPMGTLVLKLAWDAAPNHVRRFVELADAGFYDGTKFHRVLPGVLVQGGDPLTREPDRTKWGQGFAKDRSGRPVFLKAELSNRSHRKGTLSMARATNLDSASSQFFICLEDQTRLDHQYTVFGELVMGMDLLEKIGSVPRDGRDIPITDLVIRKLVIRESPLAPPATAVTATAVAAPARRPAK